MKKRKILCLFPLTGLLLSGCALTDPNTAIGKSWFGKNIFTPIENLFTGGKKNQEEKPPGGDEGGGGGEEKPADPVLQGISIAGNLSKTAYTVGEDYSYAGLSVLLNYDKGESKTATDGVTWSLSKAKAEAGDTSIKVTATYLTFSAEKVCAVTVSGGGGETVETEHAGTEEDPYSGADAVLVASSLQPGGVTEDSFYIKGVVVSFEENFDPKYGNYSFKIEGDFIGWRLKYSSSYTLFKEGDIEVGDTVTMFAKIQSFGEEGKPETSGGYVVSVEKKAIDAELTEVTIEGTPTTAYLAGASYSHEGLSAIAHYNNGQTQDISLSVTWELSKAVAELGDETLTISVQYGEFGASLAVTVTVQDSSNPSHAGTAEDPYTGLDAVIVAKKLEVSDKDNKHPTEQSFYIKDVITKVIEFSSEHGNFTFMLGGGFEGYRLKNGSEKAAFTSATQIQVGDTVTIYAQILNFNGTYENHEGYVAAIEKPAGKEIVGFVENSAVGIPDSILEGRKLDKDQITVKILYKDGTDETVHPDSIELDTSVPGPSVSGNLVVGSFKYAFTIEVTAKPVPAGDVVSFALGADGDKAHADGSAAETYEETVDGKTLSISGGTKMYVGARDAEGNGCLKFGTSSAGGSFNIDVSSITDLLSVRVYAAQYKSNTGCTIALDGGEAQAISSQSNSGEYDMFEVAITDQTSISVVFTKRAMVNSIEFVIKGAPATLVESVTVSPSELTLDVSDLPAQLTTAVLPDDATDKSVTWSSSNPEVATVSSTGLVTPVGNGTATIKATANDGSEEFGSCTVKVETHVKSIAVTSELNLVAGNTGNIVVTFTPENPENKECTYVSSNPQVATVDGGVVTAVAPGSAEITVTSVDGSHPAVCQVTVLSNEVSVDSIEVVSPLNNELKVNGTLDLEAHGMPANATQDRGVVWSLVSGEGVVTITEAGHVTALAVGTAVVRATTVSGGFTADVTIEVSKVNVTAVAVSPSSLELTAGGSAAQLSASITPDNATVKTVVWSSDNEDVATVSESGLVTPVGVGETTIYATVDGAQGSCTVSVSAPVYPKGSEQNPYSVAEARAAIAANEGVENVYAEGYVSEITTAYSSQYGNVSFNISADGLTVGDQLLAYRAVGSESYTIDSADSIQVGDKVLVHGNLTLYNNTSYQFSQGNTVESDVRIGELIGVSVGGTPSQTEYAVGSDYNHNGLTAIAHYDNGAFIDKTADSPKWSIEPTTASLNDETISVTVTYGNITSAARVIEVSVSENPVGLPVASYAMNGGAASTTALTTAKVISDFFNDANCTGTNIVSSCETATKLYPDNGPSLKFGSSSAKGELAITLSQDVSKIVINAKAYSNAQESFVILVNGQEVTLTTSYATYEITLSEPTSSISIASKTATKNRFYIMNVDFYE